LWIRRVYEIEDQVRGRTGAEPVAAGRPRPWHERKTIQFKQISPMKVIAPRASVPKPRRLVKGSGFSKNRHLLLTDADYDSVEFSR
jgi:hypothetical protein